MYNWNDHNWWEGYRLLHPVLLPDGGCCGSVHLRPPLGFLISAAILGARKAHARCSCIQTLSLRQCSSCSRLYQANMYTTKFTTAPSNLVRPIGSLHTRVPCNVMLRVRQVLSFGLYRHTAVFHACQGIVA